MQHQPEKGDPPGCTAHAKCFLCGFFSSQHSKNSEKQKQQNNVNKTLKGPCITRNLLTWSPVFELSLGGDFSMACLLFVLEVAL